MDDRLLTEHPELFCHFVQPGSVAMRHMDSLRKQYIALAQSMLDLCPPGRSRSLAFTHLEESLMRAIQSLAITGELLDIRDAQ
jgi:hypothetical protein